MKQVAVVGLGYVGLPLAIRAAEAGYRVVGYDLDDYKIKLLAAGESYVEDVSGARLAATVASGRFVPTGDLRGLAGFDICVIAVPTPLRAGKPDLACVEEAGKAVARFVRPGCLVVLESTSYPGTTEELLLPLLEQGSGLSSPGDFHLGYSPERIDPGNPTWRLENTPKVVSGVDGAALAEVERFYGGLVERTVPVSSTRAAELAKLLENTFRQVNIAVVNELAQVAGDLQVNLWEAIDAAATKPFGFMRFTPGPGVGGHCLPTDPAYLSWQVERVTGRPLGFVELANEVNNGMPSYVVRRLGESLARRGATLCGSRILLLGLAYKKNTSDLRESPALEVARLLEEAGAEVRVCDPLASPRSVPGELRLVNPTEVEVAGADATVLLTDHDCFDYGMVTRVSGYLLDTRNRCSGENVELL